MALPVTKSRLTWNLCKRGSAKRTIKNYNASPGAILILLGKDFLMAQTVRCDVCGKLFSSSHIGSHKRLAHPNEETAVQNILGLFKNLSQKSKKKVLEDLASMARDLCVAAYLVSEISEMLS